MVGRMGLLDRLNENRRVVLDAWFLAAVSSYHSDTSGFLAGQKDPFANPVGKVTFDALDGLLEGLIRETDTKELGAFVDSIMRIRAVQDFRPSDAVEFVFALKDIVRRCLCNGADCNDSVGLFSFDTRVDVLALMAFDVYVACKEQLYEMKANETRNQFFGSLSRAGLIKES